MADRHLAGRGFVRGATPPASSSRRSSPPWRTRACGTAQQQLCLGSTLLPCVVLYHDAQAEVVLMMVISSCGRLLGACDAVLAQAACARPAHASSSCPTSKRWVLCVWITCGDSRGQQQANPGGATHVFDAHRMHEVLIRAVCCWVRLSSSSGVRPNDGRGCGRRHIAHVNVVLMSCVTKDMRDPARRPWSFPHDAQNATW